MEITIKIETIATLDDIAAWGSLMDINYEEAGRANGTGYGCGFSSGLGDSNMNGHTEGAGVSGFGEEDCTGNG